MNFNHQNKKMDELIDKLNEAKKIANEISSMTITVFDGRHINGNIEEHIEELKNEFKSQHGRLPDEISLVAVSHSQLAKPKSIVSKQLFQK